MTTSPSPDLFEHLFHAAPCGLIWLDAQGVIQQINPKAAQLLGGEVERLLSTPLTTAVPAAAATMCQARLDAVRQGTLAAQGIPWDIPAARGRTLRLAAVSIANGSTETRGMLLSLMEVTEHVSIERRLHRAEFLASIAGMPHPLNGTADVSQCLERTLAAQAARMAALHVRLVKSIEPHLPLVRDGGLQPAFTHVITNALEAMPNGGTLTISARAAADAVELDIADTGTGMAELVRAKAFDAFFTTKRDRPGRGLGLTVVQESVANSGGTVICESRAGSGTTMRLRLPIAGRVHVS